MHKDGGRFVASSVEARAGLIVQQAMAVLIVDAGLIVGLLAAIYIGFFAR